ncbi:MAG: hypothetical protein PHZ07_00505 [Patescibacteria group bacterium]|nr:hypothetical protein [Patescibacteria group bacterium]MDD4304203.1 hypothetical protein [Patescibacteria group bacterium]MDD4695236.1 hypothetical protein [Patescibacteria group bacterium]
MDINDSTNIVIKKKKSDIPYLFLALFFMITCVIFVESLRKNSLNNRNNELLNRNKAGLNIDMNKTIENPTTEDLQEMINKIQNSDAF